MATNHYYHISLEPSLGCIEPHKDVWGRHRGHMLFALLLSSQLNLCEILDCMR